MLNLLKFATIESPFAFLLTKKVSTATARRNRQYLPYSAAEVLEVRCLPAATLAADLLNGKLTVSDTDGAGKDNSLTIDVVGTDLVITDAHEQFIAAPAGGTLSNGNQTLTISLSLVTAGLTVNSAGGADDIAIQSLGTSFGGDLSIDGGSGVDSVTFQSGTVTVGSGSIAVFADTISVKSAVTASGAINLTVTQDDSLLSITAPMSAGADSKFAADKMAINAAVSAGSHVLRLVPESVADAGDAIELGTTTDTAPDTLQLSDGELDQITASKIVIGDLNSGTVTITSNIEHAGDSSFDVVTGRNIVSNLFVSWATHNGNLSFIANPNSTAIGSFWGISLNGLTLTSSGTGNIQLEGHGGLGGVGNYGIMAYDGTIIASTGSGQITLKGVGGTGSQNDIGVQIEDVGTRIRSATGSISIQGHAGDSTTSYGIYIFNGAVIESTGTATIDIVGTGANADVSNGIALSASTAATRITSVDGAINITGHAGDTAAGFGTVGIAVLDGVDIRSTGNAKINLVGTGGDAIGGSAGIEIFNGSRVTSTTGDIQINGHGGDTPTGHGVWLATNAVVESKGTASITIEGTGGDGANANGILIQGNGGSSRIVSADGDITLTGHGGDAPNGPLARGVVLTAGSLVQSTGAAKITIDGTGGSGSDSSEGVEIGGSGTKISSVTGNIQITGQGGNNTSGYGVWVATGAVIESTGTAAIDIDGTGGNANDGRGVLITGNGLGTRISSVDGNISMHGQGGSIAGGDTVHGLVIEPGTIVGPGVGGPLVQSTGLATITLDGTGGTAQNGTRGVDILGAGTKVTSVSGDIHIVGHGGSAIESHGVSIGDAAVVESTGTAKITIEGFGGTGPSDTRGVQIDSANTRVISVSGDIHIMGQGGTGVGDNDNGVWLLQGATIASTGTASITIEGTGGSGTNENNGVMLNGYGTSGMTNVTAVDGDITIIGHASASATGSANRGIGLYSGAVVQSTGLGKITLNGTGGPGSDSSRGVELAFTDTRITSTTGDIQITGQGGANVSGYGIWMVDGPVIESLGSARITLNGTGGDGNDGNGVVVETSRISSVNGDITIVGKGGNTLDGDGMRGVLLQQASLIESTGGARITINGTAGAGDNALRGTEISDSTIVRSATGDIDITGHGGANAIYAFGIWVRNAAVIESTGTAKITLNGSGGDGVYGNDGVMLNGYNNGGATKVRSLDGDIHITGLGGNATGEFNWGIGMFEGAAIESSGLAKITLDGTGGQGTQYNRGIEIGDTGTEITSKTGAISLTGHGGEGGYSFGIWLRSGAVVESTDTASVTLNGTAGVGANDQVGVILNGYNSPGDTRLSSVNGAIQITGLGGGGAGGYSAGIIVYEGAAIESTGTATITLDGTGGPGTLRDYGVEMSVTGSRITSQTGDISITGHGGSGPSSYGVWVHDGAVVESTGVAKVTIDGTAGDANDAVGLAVNAGKVASVDGDISLTGQGGQSADGIGNLGVWLLFGGLVESTGTAKITLDGTGGSGGTLTRGTQLSEGGTARSTSGDIQIIGHGGLGVDGDYGILLRDGVVESLGTAKVRLNGTGGSGSEAMGLSIASTSRVTSQDGDISLIGQGGQIAPGVTPRGVAIATGSVIESKGTAKILIDGTSGLASAEGRGVEIYDDGTKITSVSGDITITGHGSPSNFAFGIWVRSGALIESTGTAAINLHGTGGDGLDSEGGDVGVIFNGYNTGGATAIRSVDGDINIIGIGGNSTTGVDNRGIGIFQGSTIESTGQAKITLDGTGGGIFAASRGVEIGDAGTSLVSKSGDISIIGRGGLGTADYGTYNMGVWIRDGAVVQSTGNDGNAAMITINGTGHSGTSGDIGVWIINSGRVTSARGDINITGQGGVGTGEYNDGVLLQTGGTIESTDSATITVTGTAGAGTRNVKGVTIEQGSRIQSKDGDVQVTGLGGTGSDSNYGVSVRTGGSIKTSGTANIQIIGVAGTGTGSPGIEIDSDSGSPGIDTSAGKGSITLIADSLNIDSGLQPGSVNAGAHTVSIHQQTDGTAIDVGGADASSILGLTDAELDRVFASNLIIGNGSSGNLTISADLTRSSPTDLQLVTGRDLLLTGGSVNTGGGSVRLSAAATPGVVNPNHPGVDVAASAATLDGDLSIAINGNSPDSGYTQLHVAGAVNLNGAHLALNGSYMPQNLDSLVIVSNDGNDAVIGNFNGLDEGSTFEFNGRVLQISYVGGDGNDVVLTEVNQAPAANDAALSVTENLAAVGTLTATDLDSATLTYAIVTNPAHGVVSLTDAATGAYTYTPAADYSGPDSFAFQANDGSLDSNVATISITVHPLNDPPQLNLNGGPVTFSAKASKQSGPVQVVPNVTVVDVDQPATSGLGGGTLTVSIDVVAKVKKKGPKFIDTVDGLQAASTLGTVTRPSYQNGKLLLTVSLNATTSTANIESFLRAITFSTKGSGVKQPQRIFLAQLTDAAGGVSNLLLQTIHVTK